ncbi:tRNA (guanosine(37)-N1)-methyltransferase TrmD [bacterium]|nr:tRNA (guanosine(37)-N1)-methyltransferase TrmD [bacterium]|tara:strand:- start:124 stop:801 length:678 start_codon:yes stop_codon:yes gene_type:complete
MLNFHIITIFPEVCKSYTDTGILGRAQKTYKGKGSKVRGKKISVSYYDPRDFTSDKHKKVDDKPYGGGPGMVMSAKPILKAWQKAVGRKKNKKQIKTLILSPRGKIFDQKLAKQYAKKYENLVLISGRYEGIDARVKKALRAEEVSVGNYVLSGGELPAMTIIDAVAREIPGVLGERSSLEDRRVTSGEVYTRPDTVIYGSKKYVVPKVLLKGNHKEIESYRRKK